MLILYVRTLINSLLHNSIVGSTDILLKQKQVRVLLSLRDVSQSWYISTLAKSSDSTYVHVCNFLSVCESLGITSSEKHGKLKVIRLTEKGLKLADSLFSITSMLSAQKQPQQEPAPQ